MESVVSDNHILELDSNEVETFINMSNIIDISPSENPELFCKQSKSLAKCLPSRIIRKLKHFARYGSETGFFLIKNIPIRESSLQNTPPGNNCKIGEQTAMARIQSIIMHVFSEIIAYEAECYGRIFQDVVPTQSMAMNQTSLGSNTELEIHTEQAFSKLRPDIISLACLRGDKNALTHILPVKRIISNITTEELEMLRKPLWNTGIDLSFKLNGHDFIEGNIRGPMSIINGEDEDPLLIFDQDLMKGTTVESEQMIQKVVDIYYKQRLSHNLKPGEIILIDNLRAVHGRSPFFPKFDGYDRFLIRCFSTFDYSKSDYARSGRVVSAIYS
jgi:L-asparagine oxygenase